MVAVGFNPRRKGQGCGVAARRLNNNRRRVCESSLRDDSLAWHWLRGLKATATVTWSLCDYKRCDLHESVRYEIHLADLIVTSSNTPSAKSILP